MNNEPIKNNAGEFGMGDEKVSRLLSAMKRVEAPNDFDFKVRARIAAGRPATRPVFGIPTAVRYAVPLILLVLVGAYFGLNAFYSTKQVNVPAVAKSEPPIAPPVAAPLSNDIVAPTANSLLEEHAAVRRPEKGRNSMGDAPVKKPLPLQRPAGGSYIESGRQEQKLYPRGIDPNAKPTTNTKIPDRTVQIPTKDVLNLFGVNGTFGESGWKVESVTPDTLAGRAGVRPGDVIEAINDQALKEKMSLKGGFNGKTLRVRRDGTTVQIMLKN